VTTFYEQLAARLETREQHFPAPGDLALAVDPTTVQTPALERIDRELVALMDNEFDRLAVFLAPQEGKSVRISHYFPLWALRRNPDLRIAIVSYADGIARRWGSDIKADTQNYVGEDGALDLGIRLRDDTRAAGRWQIDGRLGGVYCVGIGGSLTSRAVDLLIIDDPVKDLEQAQSEVYRERAMRFWRGVAIPRLGVGAKVVLIQTRFHEKDMGGQLLAEEPDRWQVLSIPAVAERADDPLGREPGQPMISARGERDWAGIRRSVGEYVWAALYQQRPAPAAGGLFRRNEVKYWTWAGDGDRQSLDLGGRIVPLDRLWKFVTADLATSLKTSADFTAAAVWGITPDGELILLDGLRAHLDPAEHWPRINALRTRWDVSRIYVEAAMNATTLANEAGRAGVPISELKPDRDKWSRAQPAAARMNVGRLWVPSLAVASWVGDWVDEWAAFPNGSHDDTVDVLSYAAQVAVKHGQGSSLASPVDALAGLRMPKIPMRLPR
jgi:predicted phage terminase large subunit-like protein